MIYNMYLTGAMCIQTRGVIMRTALQLHLSKLFNRYSTWLLKGQISSCLPDCHTQTHTHMAVNVSIYIISSLLFEDCQIIMVLQSQLEHSDINRMSWNYITLNTKSRKHQVPEDLVSKFPPVLSKQRQVSSL